MMRTVTCLLATLGLATTMGLSACAVDGTEEPDQGGKPESDGKVVDGKADEWNRTNNPERFQVEFNYKLAELPEDGEAAMTPWPDTYWPTYKDSTNQRWQGASTMSPLEKYDAAFNGWTPPEGFDELRPWSASACSQGAEGWDEEYYDKLGPAAGYQSKYKGNQDARDGVDSDGDGEVDECDDYDGVETWWGLCHAWVPASILEKEPVKAVEYNGVRFEVGDIKGLLQTVYDRTSALMLGGRCNDKEVDRDEHGRITADHCRDTNAGAFHVVTSNMLGVYKRSFAEDRTYDYQVWNQPFRSFEVLSQEEIDAKQAMEALGQPEAEGYTYNDEATRFAKVRTKVSFIVEPSQTSTEPMLPDIDRYTSSSTYDYILEMDDDGTIIGGEWIGYSRTSHPDFLWLPLAARGGGNPHVDLEKVQQLLELSTEPDQPEEPVSIESFKSTHEPIAIPDNDAAGVVGTLVVDEDITIGTLQVAVDIDHSYIGDLLVSLERDGVVIPLHDQQGGGADNLHKTFDAPGFEGVNARGTWKLLVSDHAARDKGELKSWTLHVSTAAENLDKLLEIAAQGLPIAIPDNNATGIESAISVTDEGVLKKLSVVLGVEHTYVGDLTVTLHHNGATKVLHSREGGSADDLFKTYDVTGFNGGPLAGDWVLHVTDEAGQDLGELVEWSLAATIH